MLDVQRKIYIIQNQGRRNKARTGPLQQQFRGSRYYPKSPNAVVRLKESQSGA